MEAQWVEINICEELLAKATLDSRIKRLSNVWWENYRHNPMKAISDFTDCLLRAGGIKRLPTIGDTCDSLENQLESSKIETHDDVLIFKEHFCSKFKKFLIHIMEYSDWYFFTQIGLSQQIVKLICVIGYSDWNSLRNVSYITGMKIMKEIYKCQFHCKRSPDSWKIVIEVTSQLKETIYKNIVQRSLRDKDVILRIITASELTSWFSEFENEDLKLILCPFLKHIRRNLLDERRVKIVALDLLINIYSKSAPNSLTENYKNLFDAVKSIVFGIIVRKDSIMAFKSIQLVTNAIRNFNFSLSCREEKIIFSSLFYKENSVKNEAKKLICDVLLNNFSHNELLLKVTALYNSCMAKEPALVNSCLMDLLITRVNWNDWILVITSSQINVKQAALCLFYEFSKHIANYESQEAVEESFTALYLKRTFTAVIAPRWMNLVNDDCNKLNARLLHYLISIFQLFDISLISKELLKDMRDYVLKVFLVEEEYFLIKECIQVLVMSSDDYSLNINFPDLCSAMISSIRDNNESQRLLDLISHKIILLLKNFFCDTNTFWTNLYEHLYSCPSSKVQNVVLVLFHIIMHDRRHCSTSIIKGNSESGIQWLKLHVNAFVQFLLRGLATKSSPRFLAKTLQLFSEIINHFGSHLSDNQVLHYLNFGSIIDDHILTYVEHYAAIMEQNCTEMKKECCLAVKNFGYLIMNFKINISNLQCIFHYFSPENKNHSLLIVYAIEMCLKKKPEIGKEIIKFALNGFIEYINETVSKTNCEDKHLEQILTNKVKFLIEYSKTLGKQKYICLFYLQIVVLMREGFSHLMKVKEYLEASLNSKILKMLQNSSEEGNI